MPFIPHTEQDIQAMLTQIGVGTIEQLFDEIPPTIRSGQLKQVPAGLSEQAITRLMEERANQDKRMLSFLGAGAYEHHIPAAIWPIVSRGEFYSAYTPYQAEASQGTLQLLYEYQTMMASLTGMAISNASLYDGATALAEAVLMAVRAHKHSRRILVPSTLHPLYREVLRSLTEAQAIELIEVAYCTEAGRTLLASLRQHPADSFAALILPQPNFFGVLELVDELTDWAHAQNALVIGLVNPIALGLIAPPGEWGAQGADIAVGEGQPLGIPLSSGGPYFGFICCKEALVRQMPGRIVGRTTDLEGKPGFTLTLQAREQHIRRAKATSNICTNQGLMVTAATIFMAIIGPTGLANIAATCHQQTAHLMQQLTALPGVSQAFTSPFFHEVVLRLNKPVKSVLATLETQGILGGLDLSAYYPELTDMMLVCATETKQPEDLARYTEALRQALQHV